MTFFWGEKTGDFVSPEAVESAATVIGGGSALLQMSDDRLKVLSF